MHLPGTSFKKLVITRRLISRLWWNRSVTDATWPMKEVFGIVGDDMARDTELPSSEPTWMCAVQRGALSKALSKDPQRGSIMIRARFDITVGESAVIH